MNNARIGGGGSIHDVTPEALNRLIATNIRGMLLLTQPASSRIPDGGRVINTTSMDGLAAYQGFIARALTNSQKSLAL